MVIINVGNHAKKIMMSTGFIMRLTGAPVTLAPQIEERSGRRSDVRHAEIDPEDGGEVYRVHPDAGHDGSSRGAESRSPLMSSITMQ